MKVRVENVCSSATLLITITIASSTCLKYSKKIFFKMALEANYHEHKTTKTT
jgi:hypothetical protein